MLTRFEKVRRFRSVIWGYGLYTLAAVAAIITAPIFFWGVGKLGEDGSQGVSLLYPGFMTLIYGCAFWAIAGCIVYVILAIPFCLLFGIPRNED